LAKRKLTAKYARATGEKKGTKTLVFSWPTQKSDAHFLSSVLTEDFLESLTRRGFDVTTLKFEVCLKEEEDNGATGSVPAV